MGIADLAALTGAEVERAGAGNHRPRSVPELLGLVAVGPEVSVGVPFLALVEGVEQHRILGIGDLDHALRAGVGAL